MSITTRGSKFQFDQGAGLADVVEVVSCEIDFGRSFLPKDLIGTGQQKGDHGKFKLAGTLVVLYAKAGHQKITDHIALSSAPIAANVIHAASDVMAGNVLFSNMKTVMESDQYVIATVGFNSDGVWTINGTATV